MSREQDPLTPGLGIGKALKDARRRIGMDVKEAEERTKIRARYLRALEAEDWEVLPAPAYVRGFLRTYGQLVGLDGEMLADEFRRRHEAPAAAASAAAEPILQERRRAGGRRPSRGPLIAAVAVVIVVLLVVLGWIGSGDDGTDPGGTEPAKSGKRSAGKPERKKGKSGGAALQPIDVEVEPLDDIQICLVGDAKEALIDAQVLAAGVTEAFSGAKRYRIDLDGGGAVKLVAGGESQRLESGGNASFEADSKGIREIDYAGPECP